MLKPLYAALTAALLLTSLFVAPFLLAKPKADPTLPAYILHARTVAVIVDPDAGVSLSDPNANQVAQKDVETALLNWGRFEPVVSRQQVDLILVIRKGSGRLVDTTVSDPRQNNRPGSITPSDDGVSIGGQHGRLPNASSGSSSPVQAAPPHPQTEVGNSEDSFVVYEGNADGNTDTSFLTIPGWRYVAKNALHPHDVPAVEEFKKAITAAEKAAAAQQQKAPPAQPQTNPPAPSPHP